LVAGIFSGKERLPVELGATRQKIQLRLLLWHFTKYLVFRGVIFKVFFRFFPKIFLERGVGVVSSMPCHGAI
jgi:hypothetical protein